MIGILRTGKQIRLKKYMLVVIKSSLCLLTIQAADSRQNFFATKLYSKAMNLLGADSGFESTACSCSYYFRQPVFISDFSYQHSYLLNCDDEMHTDEAEMFESDQRVSPSSSVNAMILNFCCKIPACVFILICARID